MMRRNLLSSHRGLSREREGRCATAPRADRRQPFGGFSPGKAALFTLGLCILGLTACRHPLTAKLEGRWLGDSVENFDDDQIALATGWARGTSLEFSGSTVTVTVPAEDPRSGHYKVEAVHGTDFTLAIEKGSGAVDRARFTLDQDHLMRWHLDEARSVVLRREPR